MIGLGMRRGTKMKREQAAFLNVQEFPKLARFLRDLVATTPQNKLLFPHSIDTYRRLFRSVEVRLGITAGWSPHSPRAGYASESRAEGKSFIGIREGGRWSVDASLRTYIDAVVAADITSRMCHMGLTESLVWARHHWPLYTTPELLAAAYLR